MIYVQHILGKVIRYSYFILDTRSRPHRQRGTLRYFTVGACKMPSPFREFRSPELKSFYSATCWTSNFYDSINQGNLQTAFYQATSNFIMRIRITFSKPALRSLTGFGGLAECLPWGARSQSALHVSIYNGQTIHVAGIDPSKPWKEY